MLQTVVAERSYARDRVAPDHTRGDTKPMRATSPREMAARQAAIARILRKRGDLMNLQAFNIVMEVFIRPGSTMQELEKNTDMSLASVSRNLMALGKWHRLGRPGLDLVECVDDPHERRRKIAFLTKDGREFVSDILSIGLPAEERVEVDAPSATDYLNKTYKGR